MALALKSTMENFLSGQILRLQDKFRVGEVISVSQYDKGVVEQLSPLDVTLRREDNTVVTVPNTKFNSDEVINLSRTPYRLFKTELELPLSKLQCLPTVVESIHSQLVQIPGVESSERSVFVAASGTFFLFSTFSMYENSYISRYIIYLVIFYYMIYSSPNLIFYF